MPSYSHLTESQREIIALRHTAGFSQTKIAEEIGCHKSSVSRELRRNAQSNGTYTVAHAQRQAGTRCQRQYKLERDPRARPLRNLCDSVQI